MVSATVFSSWLVHFLRMRVRKYIAPDGVSWLEINNPSPALERRYRPSMQARPTIFEINNSFSYCDFSSMVDMRMLLLRKVPTTTNFPSLKPINRVVVLVASSRCKKEH